MVINLEMKLKSCVICGLVWAVPNYLTSCYCPLCLDRKYNMRCDEIYHLNKVNAGLRGELTKRRSNG